MSNNRYWRSEINKKNGKVDGAKSGIIASEIIDILLP